MENTAQNPEKEQQEKDEKDPNVQEGKKMIEVQKKVGDGSEEESKKDAEKWRSEG